MECCSSSEIVLEHELACPALLLKVLVVFWGDVGAVAEDCVAHRVCDYAELDERALRNEATAQR